ncbi:large ribosomal subunit protein bL20m-like [Macrobrachium nipponense]|uniref:large ribosomal subunit protein bL20m-like n=1 Tax=Macrobrachium nipponense TaxID=159736 RepID=UPI0030C87F9C
MVIVSPTLFARARGADRFWKRRRILALSAHFFGRKQNCYSIAIKYVQRALRFSTKGRALRKKEMKNLWETRINAGCQEFGVDFSQMHSVLDNAGVALDRKIIQNMAVWEPRSFRGLALLTKAKMFENGLNSLQGPPDGVVTRGMV